jgi:pimeloyl-ACP methyl ester carboxylesterase
MPTARVNANGIEIAYETIGDERGRPLLLVMGLGAQMILWDDDFCNELANRGHRVIRFDNRDVGESSKLDHLGAPDVMTAMGAWMTGQPVKAAYTLSDMADDTAGLLDALRIDSAHVVGASLGGMIAQTMAIEHPRRVKSLTSIMSSTGNRALPPAKPEALQALLTAPPPDRAGAIERVVNVFRTIGSPGFAFDEVRVRDVAGRSYDRAFHPVGVTRQLVASLASGSRKEKLTAVRCPTLVIHGKEDPLILAEAAHDTVEAIPGAELLVIDGMGHDLPRQVWPQMVDAISRLTERAETQIAA